MHMSFTQNTSRLLTAALLSLFIFPTCGIAEDLESQLRNTVDQLKKSVHEGKPDSVARSESRAKDKISAMERSVESSTEVVEADPSDAILDHVTLGKGIPFPKPEEVVVRPPLEIEIDFEKERANAVPVAPLQPQIPRRCTNNSTIRISRDVPDKSEEVIYDVLYIPAEYLPLDPAEAFGNETRVRVVGGVDSKEVLEQLIDDAIPCIPFRTRIIPGIEFRDFGKVALRNYGKKQTGKGVLHPSIAQKIGERG